MKPVPKPSKPESGHPVWPIILIVGLTIALVVQSLCCNGGHVH